MSGRKRASLSGALVCLGLLVAGCSAPPGPPSSPVTPIGAPAAGAPAASSPTAEAEKLQFGRLIGTISLNYIALDMGFWAEEGLDIEMPVLDSAARMIPLLASGQLDVGLGASSAGLFNAAGRGLPLRIVAGAARPAPGQSITAFVVRKALLDSSQVRTFADLRGRSVAIPAKGTSTQALLAAGLARDGLTTDDLELVEMNYTDQLAAFANGALDVGFQIEPSMTVGELRGLFGRWTPIDEIYPYHEDGMLLFGPSLVEAAPETARRFMIGYLRGLRAYREALRTPEGRERIVQIWIKNGGPADHAIYDRMTFPYVDPNGHVNRDSLAWDAEWLFANGYLQAKPDFGRLVDDQFVDYAVQRLGAWHE